MTLTTLRVPILLALLTLAGCLANEPAPPQELPGGGGPVTDDDVAALPSPVHNLTLLHLAEGTLSQATGSTALLPRFLDDRRIAHSTGTHAALLGLDTGAVAPLGQGTLVAAGGGKVMVARNADASFTIHEVAPGREPRLVVKLPCHASPPGAVSPDGGLLAIPVVCSPTSEGRWDASVRLVRLADGAAWDVGAGSSPSFDAGGRLHHAGPQGLVRHDPDANATVVTLPATADEILGRPVLDAHGRLWHHAQALGEGGRVVRDEVRVVEPTGGTRTVVATSRYALHDFDVSPDASLLALSFVRERDAVEGSR